MTKMIAKLPTSIGNAKNLDGDKEHIATYKVVCVSSGGIPVELIDCRVWMGRSSNASVVYASVWIQDSAGVELFGSAYTQNEDVDYTKRCYINGVGQSAVKGVLFAIAQAMGYDTSKCIIV